MRRAWRKVKAARQTPTQEYMRTHIMLQLAGVKTRAAMAASVCFFSDTSACRAADKQAPSDTNHRAEAGLSHNLLSGPPSFHLSVTLRGVASARQGATYPQVS